MFALLFRVWICRNISYTQCAEYFTLSIHTDYRNWSQLSQDQSISSFIFRNLSENIICSADVLSNLSINIRRLSSMSFTKRSAVSWQMHISIWKINFYIIYRKNLTSRSLCVRSSNSCLRLRSQRHSVSFDISMRKFHFHSNEWSQHFSHCSVRHCEMRYFNISKESTQLQYTAFLRKEIFINFHMTRDLLLWYFRESEWRYIFLHLSVRERLQWELWWRIIDHSTASSIWINSLLIER